MYALSIPDYNETLNTQKEYFSHVYYDPHAIAPLQKYLDTCINYIIYEYYMFSMLDRAETFLLLFTYPYKDPTFISSQ